MAQVPTVLQDGLRREALDALQRCVQDLPDACVRVFGSAVNGFGDASSDLNFSIEVPWPRLAELFRTRDELRAKVCAQSVEFTPRDAPV